MATTYNGGLWKGGGLHVEAVVAGFPMFARGVTSHNPDLPH